MGLTAEHMFDIVLATSSASPAGLVDQFDRGSEARGDSGVRSGSSRVRADVRRARASGRGGRRAGGDRSGRAVGGRARRHAARVAPGDRPPGGRVRPVGARGAHPWSRPGRRCGVDRGVAPTPHRDARGRREGGDRVRRGLASCSTGDRSGVARRGDLLRRGAHDRRGSGRGARRTSCQAASTCSSTSRAHGDMRSLRRATAHFRNLARADGREPRVPDGLHLSRRRSRTARCCRPSSATSPRRRSRPRCTRTPIRRRPTIPGPRRSAPRPRSCGSARSRSRISATRTRPKAAVTVVVDWPTLTDGRPGRCDGVFTGPIHPDDVRRLLCDCSVSRVVTGPKSEPLDVGRSRRTVPPPHATRARRARPGLPVPRMQPTRPGGATRITSSTGSTAARPRPRTRRCSAIGITTCCTKADGEPSSTAPPSASTGPTAPRSPRDGSRPRRGSSAGRDRLELQVERVRPRRIHVGS